MQVDKGGGGAGHNMITIYCEPRNSHEGISQIKSTNLVSNADPQYYEEDNSIPPAINFQVYSDRTEYYLKFSQANLNVQHFSL